MKLVVISLASLHLFPDSCLLESKMKLHGYIPKEMSGWHLFLVLMLSPEHILLWWHCAWNEMTKLRHFGALITVISWSYTAWQIYYVLRHKVVFTLASWLSELKEPWQLWGIFYEMNPKGMFTCSRFLAENSVTANQIYTYL